MSPEQDLHKHAEQRSFENIMFDDADFKAFFKEYFIPLCLFCKYKFDFDLDLAKEAVHTAFIKLWENRANISPDLSLKAYMYKVVTNISLDILKHRKVKEQHKLHIEQNTAAILLHHDYESADFKDLKNHIDKAVLELPEQINYT